MDIAPVGDGMGVTAPLHAMPVLNWNIGKRQHDRQMARYVAGLAPILLDLASHFTEGTQGKKIQRSSALRQYSSQSMLCFYYFMFRFFEEGG